MNITKKEIIFLFKSNFKALRSSRYGSAITWLVLEDAGSIPGLAQWVKYLVSYSVRCRCSLDLAWLWLCCMPAAAALIWPLAWGTSRCGSEKAKINKFKKNLKIKKKLWVQVICRGLTNCLLSLLPILCPPFLGDHFSSQQSPRATLSGLWYNNNSLIPGTSNL